MAHNYLLIDDYYVTKYFRTHGLYIDWGILTEILSVNGTVPLTSICVGSFPQSRDRYRRVLSENSIVVENVHDEKSGIALISSYITRWIYSDFRVYLISDASYLGSVLRTLRSKKKLSLLHVNDTKLVVDGDVVSEDITGIPGVLLSIPISETLHINE